MKPKAKNTIPPTNCYVVVNGFLGLLWGGFPGTVYFNLRVRLEKTKAHECRGICC